MTLTQCCSRRLNNIRAAGKVKPDGRQAPRTGGIRTAVDSCRRPAYHAPVMKNAEAAAIGRRVVARIVEVRGRHGPGRCSYGHSQGEVFEVGEVCPSMCTWAFNALFPFATVLRFGGSLPWEKDPKRAMVSCPDPDNTVVFELEVVD